MIKNILIGTILVLVMIASAGATEVRVDPASQPVAAGDPFHVDLVVVDVYDLKGTAATLNFDPGAMQVIGITEGAFLKTGGTTVPLFDWDNTTGTATFASTLGFYSPWTTVSGSGTLATIQFSTYPDAPADRYDLNLTGVELRNASNKLIPTNISNGTVTILNDAYQRGDLNHDNEITPADAVIALRITAGSHPFDDAADVSGDGWVTALDALMILQAAVGAIKL
ncbi:MAG: dockerin type I domain-containing protein [Euryarchaeota archaeon]|nr:dockerin type I domain-containing protein [Euryarchaeota archaeon]